MKHIKKRKYLTHLGRIIDKDINPYLARCVTCESKDANLDYPIYDINTNSFIEYPTRLQVVLKYLILYGLYKLYTSEQKYIIFSLIHDYPKDYNKILKELREGRYVTIKSYINKFRRIRMLDIMELSFYGKDLEDFKRSINAKSNIIKTKK